MSDLPLPSRIPPRGSVDQKFESTIQYKVNPRRNYMSEIDAELPPWQPDAYESSQVLNPGAAYSANGGPRLAVDHINQREYELPQFKYVRALNPAGKVMPLIISTCRPGPEFPNGDDRLGTEYRVIGEKRKKGWLVLERGESWAGREGDDYLAWCFAVKDLRKAINAHHESVDQKDHESKLLSAMRTQSEMISQAVVNAQRQGKAE